MITRNIRHCRQDTADLSAEIAQLRAEGRELLGAPGATRTPAQTARLTAIDTQVTTLTARAADLATELAQFERFADEERSQGTLGGAAAATHITPPARGRTFAEMFPSIPRSAGGFASSEEFLATLHSGLADPRLIPAYAPAALGATMTGTVPSDGGFSVPTQVFGGWLDASLESEIVRPRADVRPMTSSEAVAPGWDDGNHTSNLYGGFTGQWVAEGGEITETQPLLRLIKLHARKLAILTRCSNELIADGVSFEMQLGQAITRALGWFLDTAFLSGAGAANPMGVLNSACTITVTKETGQAAGTIVYANIAKMFGRLHPSSFENSVWVCNSTAIPYLLQLSIPMGAGGAHIPVMTESGGKFRMLTRPVVFTEKVPALGTKGDIGLYDFSSYQIGMRAEFQLAKSGHAGFATDTSYYRGIIRVDGQPKLNAPITPLNGSTLSPFVVLETRS